MGVVGSVAIALLLSISFDFNNAQDDIFKVCAELRYTQECQALERGSSTVSCEFVSDSTECFLKMEQGRADFSIFSAEEGLVSAIMKKEFQALASVRHNEKRNQTFAFQSVALVSRNHTGGLPGLSGGRLCHPGYGKGIEQLWSDRVLKYFEKKTAGIDKTCDKSSKTSAEDDAIELSKFFTEACRPGPWISDKDEDDKLKKKFPSLCTLCTSNRDPDCNGYRYFEPYAPSNGANVNSHLSAIECLASEKGTVAYVAYSHVLEYFKSRESNPSSYALLCENGTTIPFNASSNLPQQPPCAWIRQPWGVLISRTAVAENLLKNFRTWMPSGRANRNEAWIESLDNILFGDYQDFALEYLREPNSVDNYITEGRSIPSVDNNSCHKPLRWCTINEAETQKCNWVQAIATSLGIQPDIKCVQGSNDLDCLSIIRQDRADFISIDSNLGFLARKYYNASSAIYEETMRANMSRVFAVIKDTHKEDINRFENLKDKNACFPEYGGIAWVAFVRAAQEQKVISSKECDYANAIVNFFGSSCAPGATDPAHFPSQAADPLKLCEGCRGFSPRNANEQGIVNLLPDAETCPADPINKFYGNKGALYCLSQPDSHVAFIEGQNLANHATDLGLKPSDFRILCRNGSLADRTGFNVDIDCALSSTIDGEVMRRKSDPDSLNLQLLLQDLDSWFGYTVSSTQLVSFKIFSPFNGTKNLLFKDSTIGFATRGSDIESVLNYVDLFKHTDSCTGNGALSTTIPSFIALFAAIIYHFFSMMA